MSEQPLVRLMPEYSAPMPLWGRWQELELPELLLRRLAAWQEDFDSKFHRDHGWKSSAARKAWGPTRPHWRRCFGKLSVIAPASPSICGRSRTEPRGK
jgi:hypothetical protein